MKKLILFVTLSLFASTIFANVQRVIIDNSTKTDSGLDFNITFDRIALDKENELRVRVTLPKEQKALDNLWKVYLWVSEPGLSVPIDTNFSKNSENYEIYFTADKNLIQESTLAIRCGELAPLSELIYQVNLGSFLKAHNKALNKDATTVAPIS